MTDFSTDNNYSANNNYGNNGGRHLMMGMGNSDDMITEQREIASLRYANMCIYF